MLNSKKVFSISLLVSFTAAFCCALLVGCGKENNQESLESKRLLENSTLAIAVSLEDFDTKLSLPSAKDAWLTKQVYEPISSERILQTKSYNSDSQLLMLNFSHNVRFSNGMKLHEKSLASWLDTLAAEGISAKFDETESLLKMETGDPQRLMQKLGDEKYWVFMYDGQNKIGTGPYRLGVSSDSSLVRFTRNAYFDSMAHFSPKKINLHYGKINEKVINQFTQGEIDIAYLSPAEYFEQQHRLNLAEYPDFYHKSSADSAVVWALFEGIDSTLVYQIAKKLYAYPKFFALQGDQWEEQFFPLLPAIPIGTLPLAQHDSTVFAEDIFQKYLQLQGVSMDNASGSIHFFTRPSLPSQSNIDQHLTAEQYQIAKKSNTYIISFNYWTGKIVYQYYITNIDCINFNDLLLQQIHVKRAEELN